ncbi:galactose-specific lectin nattectin-like isoform X2 [Nerophis ophidion]|uniref:galactose-specific lectin nattectin-like isoform X2 n=1 Tax=Nerophis ophidion TaxID=159077 RepID=UPI002AE0509E|nr:galactose-specific lectin nattectin-like isoform X2 [Nerophis ophidion]
MASELWVLFLICGISGLFTGAESSENEASVRNPDNQCPEGWTRLDNRCFILGTIPMNFTAAEATCNQFGGNLASIHNQMEVSVINGLTFIRDISEPWIGLRNEVDLDLSWTDQSEVDFFLRPSDNDGECGTQNVDDGETFWKFSPCDTERPFVCARDVYQCVSICMQEVGPLTFPQELQSTNPLI